eukprot:m.20883 g.20883  ORF g.20883 m.20883 type:complete len:330 (-) comp11063_c0_seq1:97-1086(-)
MAYSLRIQWPTGRKTVKDELTASTTMADFQNFVATLTGIAVGEQRILAGYPVTTVNFDPALADKQTLHAVGLHRGETVRIEKMAASAVSSKPPSSQMTVPATATPTMAPPSSDTTERPLRRVVPADNSCLFRAIAYLLHPEVVVLGCSADKVPDALATSLRTTVANTVAADPDTYSEAMLGKPPADYAKWIQRSESWGGGIELAIFAHEYATLLCAVDIQTLRVDCYGQDKDYSHCAFLIYDGIHYDAMVLGPGSNPPDAFCTRVFDRAALDSVSVAMVAFAKEQQQQRLFTDTSGFELRCLVCNKLLKGQTGAQAHAKETGHMNFGEV